VPVSTEQSLAEFAAELSSVHPSPGGGCASAVSAAFAAALVAKVARQTAASDDPFADLAEEMEAVAVEADELRGELLALVDAAMEAFDLVIGARRMGSADDVQAAYRAAVGPPLRVCGLSLRVRELAAEVAERGHPYAAADAGGASLFASAALETAALSVELELTAIDDAAFRADRAGELAAALRHEPTRLSSRSIRLVT
jgi:methenyltetrahydrofolate cyclohydrolase